MAKVLINALTAQVRYWEPSCRFPDLPGVTEIFQITRKSLQPRVLVSSLLKDGDVGVGIFPHREEVLVGGERTDAGGVGIRSLRGSRLQSICTSHSQMRQGSDDIGIRRENVARVTLLDKSHRLRNSLIFGGVGAGAGAGIGAAAYRCNAFCFVGRGVAVGFGGLVGLAGGAGVGAAMPSHPTIYRIEHR